MLEGTALITGASSGIGRELAHEFARARHTLVLLARDQAALERVADELRAEHRATVSILTADLALPGAAARVEAEVKARALTVDILVNNAGFGLRGPHAALDATRQSELLQVNVHALMELTRRFLPDMLTRGRGGVLNVASTAAFQGGPGMALYYASKAFVLSYSEALHEEVAGSGVHVTCLCPGPTHTAFVERAGMQGVRLFDFGADSAKAVARQGYQALTANRAVHVCGLRNRMAAFATRLAPRALSRRVAQWLNR